MPPTRSEPRSTPSRRGDTTKVISACTNCKAKKVKCSGVYPCVYCARRELHCTFPASEDTRIHSLARIRELETRLALYEPRIATPVTPFPPRSEESASQRISTERDIGSSQDFGYRVQNLFERKSARPSDLRTQLCKSTRDSLFPTNQQPLRPRISRPGWTRADLKLPSEEGAFQLLDTVLFYFEEPQHLFDARDVSDRLTAFYENQSEKLDCPNILVLQILVILALGRLLRGEQDDDGSPPGTRLFSFACDLLPNPESLRSHGVAGMEVLVIIAIYLQNVDRKEEAATYVSLFSIHLPLTDQLINPEIGLALRLATLHKLHRKATTKHLRRSEATHVSRLWWTIHWHDKRLTIATGCPLSLEDKSIDACLLSDSPGFPNPSAMQINFDIAHIQTRIYSVIYSNESCPKDVFLASVEGIISSLHEIASRIELNYPFITTQSSRRQLRTSISLYTMLYQAIILTLRPIVLHLTKSILDREITFSESSHAFQHLTRTCVEAARRCLELMVVSQKESMIAIFGFFDLDSIFSAGFIMLLAAIIDAASAGHDSNPISLKPSPGIHEVLQLLEWLRVRGNHPAGDRSGQILQLYRRIPSLITAINLSEEAQEYRRIAQAEGTAAGFPEYYSVDLRMSGASMEELAQTSLPIQFPTDPHDMYTLYHDEDFVLTGGDMADFEELQRHLLGGDG